MMGSDPAGEGRRRADAYLTLRAAGDDDAADRLLADLPDIRDLAFLGAALTTLAHRAARDLPAAQRAQATGRHMRLAALRDANRDDADGLRSWLRRVAEEVALVRAQGAPVRRDHGPAAN